MIFLASPGRFPFTSSSRTKKPAAMPARAHESKGIASWPEEEHPRERLLSCGPQALTDAELVAILIRVGFKGTSAVELARQLLNRFGSLRAMVQAPVLAGGDGDARRIGMPGPRRIALAA